MIRSSPGWATRGELLRMPTSPQSMARQLKEEGKPEDEALAGWVGFAVKIGKDHSLQLDFQGASFSTWLPEEAFWMLRHAPLSVSVATPSGPAKWGLCIGRAPAK